ncbi:hypothetical protein NIES2104_63260 [Leptolyngbya sp. NIES-2104]|nr:hypothetical protein NIES2104_63260 [Leptolyngbya sp. NIES-2104]
MQLKTSASHSHLAEDGKSFEDILKRQEYFRMVSDREIRTTEYRS